MCDISNVWYTAEAEELGSNTLELDGKKITVELKRNDQGKFVKIIETQVHVRGRIILSSNKALELRSILSEFVAEYERLPPAEETTESERIKTYAIEYSFPYSFLPYNNPCNTTVDPPNPFNLNPHESEPL